MTKDKEQMKILIVKLGSIGDVVHALPALATIRRTFPAAEISWTVERRAAEILRDNPFLHRLIEIDTRGLRGGKQTSLAVKLNEAKRQLADLRSEKYDVAIDFQGLHKSALIARLAGAGRRVGFDKKVLREPTSRFLLTETVKIPQRVHVIEKNLRLAAAALSIPFPQNAAEYEFPIAVSGSHEQEAADLIRETNQNFAILNPGGGWTTKLWSAQNFARLADRLWQDFNLKSIVTFGPGEEMLANRIVENSRTGRAVAANLSLKGFYALAQKAQIYVGGDTGPTHLAAAARAPVVGLFGPTEWWRNGSPFSEDVCVERTDIGCRENCYRRRCSNWICMNIEIEPVLRAIEKRLKLPKPNFRKLAAEQTTQIA